MRSVNRLSAFNEMRRLRDSLGKIPPFLTVPSQTNPSRFSHPVSFKTYYNFIFPYIFGLSKRSFTFEIS